MCFIESCVTFYLKTSRLALDSSTHWATPNLAPPFPQPPGQRQCCTRVPHGCFCVAGARPATDPGLPESPGYAWTGSLRRTQVGHSGGRGQRGPPRREAGERPLLQPSLLSFAATEAHQGWTPSAAAGRRHPALPLKHPPTQLRCPCSANLLRPLAAHPELRRGPSVFVKLAF